MKIEKYRFVVLIIFFLSAFKFIAISAHAQISPHLECLNTETGSKARPNLAMPGYLQTVTDPVFGSKITRITNEPNCSHHYSKDQAWNADGSLLWLWKNCSGGRILDGKTYAQKSSTSAGGNDRWHPTDPNLMIKLTGNSVSTYCRRICVGFNYRC